MAINLSSLCLVLALTSLGASALECNEDTKIIVKKMLKTYYFNEDVETRHKQKFTLDACSFEMDNRIGSINTKVIFENKIVCPFEFDFVRVGSIKAKHAIILENNVESLMDPDCEELQDHLSLIPVIVEEKLNFDEVKTQVEAPEQEKSSLQIPELKEENVKAIGKFVEDLGSFVISKIQKDVFDEIDNAVLSVSIVQDVKLQEQLANSIEALEGDERDETSNVNEENVLSTETLELKHQTQRLEEEVALPKDMDIKKAFKGDNDNKGIDEVVDVVYQTLDVEAANKVEDIETKRKVLGEKIVVGGWKKCDKEQEAEFVGSIVKHLNLAASDVIDTKIITCKTQLVAGLNVELTIGTGENNCHAHLFFSLFTSAPEIDLRSNKCVPRLAQEDLLPEFESIKCSEFNQIKAFNAFKTDYKDKDLERAYEENVVSCTQEKVDGIKITLNLSFNENTCVYRYYIAKDGISQTVGTLDCKL